MPNPLDPCLPFEAGELPDSTLIINGGVIVVPEDDGDGIIIDRLPDRPNAPEIEVPPPGGGDGSGPTIPGTPTGPLPRGPGPSTGPAGPSTGGPSSPPRGPTTGFPRTPKWKCEEFGVLGFGGMVTSKRCVSGFDSDFNYNSLADCERECTPSRPPEEEEYFPQDNQYENYAQTELGSLVLDESYFPISENISNNSVTTPSFSEFNQNFLSPQISTSIYNIVEGVNLHLSSINDDVTNLKDTYIKNSIKEELRNILYNLYLPDGRRAGESVINKAFKTRILNGTLSKVNLRYALGLALRAALAQTTVSTQVTNAVLTATYGKTIKQIIDSRVNNFLRLTQSTPSIQSTAPDINRAINRIESKKISLYPDNHTDGNKELVNLWYVLPEDIYVKTLIIDSSGTTNKIKIPNSEKIPVITSGYESTGVSVLEYGYDACVITETGYEIIPSTDELDRAYTINNNVEQACLFDAQDKYKVIFSVSSLAASNLELTYDLSASRPTQYVFLLDKSTIHDVDHDGSLFVRKTRANYKIETNTNTIQQNIEFRPFPWLVLPVNHNDPILGHFHTSSTYQLEFTNFSFYQFGDDATGPILVRRVPKCVILQPTDRYDFLFYSGYSRLTDWNSRSLSFTLSPDPTYYDPKIKNHYFANIELAYPNPDITGEYTETGMRAVYSSATATEQNLFISGSEPPRSAHGFRAAVNIASALNTIYYTDEGLLWTDIYKRMTFEQYCTFKIGVPNYMVDRLRMGQKTGIKIFHNKQGSLAMESRLLGLKPNKVDNLPIYLQI